MFPHSQKNSAPLRTSHDPRQGKSLSLLNHHQDLSKSSRLSSSKLIESPRVHPSMNSRIQDFSTPNIICLNDHHSVTLVLQVPGSMNLNLNPMRVSESEEDSKSDSSRPRSESQRIDLTRSFYLKSPLSFFSDILRMTHISGNNLKSLSSFSESLSGCFSKHKAGRLNHEVENNLKKLREYCKKNFENCSDASVLYGLNVKLAQTEELKFENEFLADLGCHRITGNSYPCDEFFEDFSIGVCLHQYYLIDTNQDLRANFYSHQNRFEIGQKLLKKTFKLLNFLKIQKIFSEVSDVRSFQPFQIFFSFFSGILENFLKHSKVQDLGTRIKKTLKKARKDPESFVIDEF